MRDDVTTTDEMTDAQEYTAIDRGVLPAIAPVPVVIVEPAPVREMPARSFVVSQYVMRAGEANRIVIAKHIARLTVHIRNIGTANLYIGQDSFVATASSGYPLPPGGAIEMDTNHDVWLFTDGLKAADGTAGGTATAAVLQTFTDGA